LSRKCLILVVLQVWHAPCEAWNDCKTQTENKDQEGKHAMFDQRFASSKLGLAALASIAAMVAFNIFALSHQMGASGDILMVAAPMVELA
jgi:hypothetical protein